MHCKQGYRALRRWTFDIGSGLLSLWNVVSAIASCCCLLRAAPHDMAVVPVIPVVPPYDYVDGESNGMVLRMCEDNTSHPVEMPKLRLYPPDYKVVCCGKRGCVNF